MSDQIPKELDDLLKRFGLDPGQWGETPEKTATSPFANQQQKMLLKLRNLLEGLAEKDRRSVAALREQIIRLEHGGGS